MSNFSDSVMREAVAMKPREGPSGREAAVFGAPPYRKVFLSAIRARPAFRDMDDIQWESSLEMARRSGELQLMRADMPQYMDPEAVMRSEFADGLSRVHFVAVEGDWPKKEKEMTKAMTKAKAKAPKKEAKAKAPKKEAKAKAPKKAKKSKQERPKGFNGTAGELVETARKSLRARFPAMSLGEMDRYLLGVGAGRYMALATYAAK